MRPLGVVMRDIRRQRLLEVSLPEDWHPVGELGADGQHEAFGEAVRSRATRRDLDHLDACMGQHRIKRARELPGPVTDEEPRSPRPCCFPAAQQASYSTGSTVVDGGGGPTLL
jgi:hypothetical protein